MKKYKPIYIVACIEGCYSSQRFWIECCFLEKDMAIKFKELKDLEEEKIKINQTICRDEREYFITKTFVINDQIDLESIDINNIFDYLGLPDNKDIDTEKED